MMWALSLLLAGEMSVHLRPYLHTNHAVGYSLVQCPPSGLDPGTQPFINSGHELIAGIQPIFA